MTRSSHIAILLSLSLAGLAAADLCPPADGVPLPPAYLEYRNQHPNSHEFARAWHNRRPDRAGVAGKQAGSVAGQFEVPLFLVRFADSGGDPYLPQALEAALFDAAAPQSMRSYYAEISHGRLELDGHAFGWHQLPQTASYYAGSSNGTVPGNAHVGELLDHALRAYDAQVDFGRYDNDGPDGVPNSGDDDGYVDFVGFVQPLSGGECGGNANIWSHRWRYSAWPISSGSPFVTGDLSVGGGPILIDDYTIQPALACDGSSPIQIGIFCHEFGHAFGLPDLYDINGGGAGLGHWCLMASGNWNRAASPAHMSAWAKQQLGWVSTERLDWRTRALDIAPVIEAPVVYELPIHEERWARRDACALAGDTSLSVGLDAAAAAARGYYGIGYGNAWRETIARDFRRNGGGTVSLSFRYAVDSEPAFDFFFVLVQQNGVESMVAVYSGLQSGTAVHDLTRYLPTDGPYRIAFRFVSDRHNSTEDRTYFSQCLPVVLDEIRVNGGGENYRADFETHVGGWFSPRTEHDNPIHERWLLENRQASGFDTHVHGSGLLIYHVDDEVLGSNLLNSGGATNLQTRGILLEEADGQADLVKFGGGRGDAGDVWSGGDAARFDATTLPSSLSNSGMDSGVALWDIRSSDDHVQLFARVGEPAPSFAGVAPDSLRTRDLIWLDLVDAAHVRHDATLRLEGAGLPTLLATQIEWTDQDRVRAQFSLSGLPNGSYDLVLAHADGQTALRPGALTLDIAAPTDGPLPALALALHQNAPNPFNPATWIRFDLPQASEVELLVFDARGRQVRALLQGSLPAGSHGVKWDGRDESGNSVASGLYFYRLQADDQLLRRKMALVR